MWKIKKDGIVRWLEITLPMQEYPDLNRMLPKEFDRFSGKSRNLTAYHKEQLAKEHTSNNLPDIEIIIRVVESRNSFTSFIHIFCTIKYFLKHLLYDKFREVDNVLSQAVQTYEEGKRIDDYKQVIEAYKLLDKRG